MAAESEKTDHVSPVNLERVALFLSQNCDPFIPYAFYSYLSNIKEGFHSGINCAQNCSLNGQNTFLEFQQSLRGQ